MVHESSVPKGVPPAPLLGDHVVSDRTKSIQQFCLKPGFQDEKVHMDLRKEREAEVGFGQRHQRGSLLNICEKTHSSIHLTPSSTSSALDVSPSSHKYNWSVSNRHQELGPLDRDMCWLDF